MVITIQTSRKRRRRRSEECAELTSIRVRRSVELALRSAPGLAVLDHLLR